MRQLALLLHCALASSCIAADLWKPGPGYRSFGVSPPPSERPGFSLQPPPTTGILFSNLLSEDRHLTNQILLNGSGVAAGDINNDGLTDLYFCGLDSPNALYRNLGNWRFEEVASS